MSLASATPKGVGIRCHAPSVRCSVRVVCGTHNTQSQPFLDLSGLALAHAPGRHPDVAAYRDGQELLYIGGASKVGPTSTLHGLRLVALGSAHGFRPVLLQCHRRWRDLLLIHRDFTFTRTCSARRTHL